MSCPRHPRWDRDGDCPFCEALIERAEIARDDPDPLGQEADRAADRYEKWLNER